MASKNRGLGKGFGSLLPETFDESILLDKKDRIQKLFVNDILPDPKQPRKNFNELEIHELSLSIKRFGILQPIVVTPHENSFMIVAGERRYHAAKRAGLTHIPALVRTLEELERLEIGLIENMQRVDLSPIEQALSIARLNQQFNIAYPEIAKRLGKAHTTVINIVRLLQLPDSAREALDNREISEGHARAVLALKLDPSKQEELLVYIRTNNWSVRQAEQFVTAHKSKLIKKPAIETGKRIQINNKDTSLLSKKLKASVKITQGIKGGSIQIEFDSDKDLKRILELLIDS